MDRTAYSMTSVDIVANQTYTSNNINQNAMYAVTNQFDFVGFVKIVNENPTQYTLDKFWGWENWTYGACENGFQRAERKHFIFWCPDVVGFDYVRCGDKMSDSSTGRFR